MAARGSRLHELVILENEPYNQELGISCSALGLASGMVRAHRSHVRTCGLGIRMSGPIFMILRGTVVGQVSFEAPPPIWAAQRLPNRVPLSPGVAVLLAISFGLCGGYLDLLFMLFRKFCWDQEGFVRSGRDFPWTVPLAHTLLLLIPGVAIAAISRLRPRFVTMRAAAWLFAVLAIWAALLRLPLYGACTFVLAVGLGRPISAAVASRAWRAATVGYTLAGLLFLLGFLGAFSSGRQAIREHLAVAGLPPPPTAARNVVLIVWDTVRAYNLSAYGYPRNTTPNLARWAREGVLYNLAITPAPWTYPSHSCFFTGRWPFQLNSQWKISLDTPDPTLAENLAARGYQTAGFAANTTYCSYETGLDRGFAHYEDFPLSSRSFLGRTVPGSWIADEHAFSRPLSSDEVDRPPIPWCVRDQRRFPRLAAATADGSSLLRISELFRCPRAVRTSAGI